MQTRVLAEEVVKTLVDAGYIAYFAGGWVRDFLMKRPSSDIDIATDAPPDVVVKLFDNTVQVGAFFGVVVVVLEKKNFEVASFRKDGLYIDGRKPEGVEFSTPKEDASRRDFTINGMFYDPLTGKIIDFVDGQKDLEKGVVRAIGDPHHRFAEDRLRMIRAVRFAVRFNFKIEEETERAIFAHAHQLLPAVSMERVWQEFRRMHLYSGFDRAICELHRLKLLQSIFPILKDVSTEEIKKRTSAFSRFPQGCPTVLYLMELFPKSSLEERLDICKHLRATKRDCKLAKLARQGEKLLGRAGVVEPVEWMIFYADQDAFLYLKVVAAHFTEEKSHEFLAFHRKSYEKLIAHIRRYQTRKPLVTAEVLKKEGIVQGKKMGILLKEAEKIAVNEDLNNPEDVFNRLKNCSVWREG